MGFHSLKTQSEVKTQAFNCPNPSVMTNTEFPHIPFSLPDTNSEELLERSQAFLKAINSRRSVRFFSDRPVPREVMENLILAASTAPSGAHKQPWTFCLVGDPDLKSQIRKAAEKEEFESYHKRMSEEWLKDLAPIGTDWRKPFLETAPWLVIIFKKSYDVENGEKQKNYYVNESVGIASGFFLTATHMAGLAALTHTPSPMDFLIQLLGRPANERPYLLIPVGYPTKDCTVPDFKRKSLEQVCISY